MLTFLRRELNKHIKLLSSWASIPMSDCLLFQVPQHKDKVVTFLGAKPTTDDLTELLLNQTWRPQLTVIGATGLPLSSKAGNVLQPEISLKLSVRVPPHVDSVKATQSLKNLLEKDPPYGAQVSFTWSSDGPCNGWESPILPDWLEKSVDSASQKFFNKPSVNMGEGGSIPFMAMLGERFPQAHFVITGVLGPGSNAHGMCSHY